MQLKYSNGKIAHVENSVGRAIVDAGLATEIPTEVKKLGPDTQWCVNRGTNAGDYEFPPNLSAYCRTCGNKQFAEGPTSEKTFQYRHCGVVEPVPAHIAREYARARDEYNKRSRNRRPVPVSSESSRADARFLGLKTREELIAEQVVTPRK